MTENLYPQYPTRKAIDSLAEKLNLPKPYHVFEQDWEFMVSDISRIPEFIWLYENGELDVEEKFTLMIIIIDSYNDMLWEGCAKNCPWERIAYLLINETHIHRNTILYWALVDDEDRNLEDCFAVTPLMRKIMRMVGM